jgi:hypothetical protein
VKNEAQRLAPQLACDRMHRDLVDLRRLRQLLARDSAPLVGIGLDETAIDRQVVPVHGSDSGQHATIS